MELRITIASRLLAILLETGLRRAPLPMPAEWEAMAVELALSLTDRLLSRALTGEQPSHQGEGSGVAPPDPFPGGGRELTEHQRHVKELAEIFASFQTEAPKPGVLAHWIKFAGFDATREVLLDLGGRGHLDKGTAYVYQVLHSRAQMLEALEQLPAAGPVELLDGTGLPGGQRWSAQLGRPVPAADWAPVESGEQS